MANQSISKSQYYGNGDTTDAVTVAEEGGGELLFDYNSFDDDLVTNKILVEFYKSKPNNRQEYGTLQGGTLFLTKSCLVLRFVTKISTASHRYMIPKRRESVTC